MLRWRNWARVAGAALLLGAAWYGVRWWRRTRRAPRTPSLPPPSDADELEGLFARAAQHVGSGKVPLAEDAQLRFYGLYKCATVGPAPAESQAGLFDYVARRKWGAWSALGPLSKNDAKAKYVELLDALDPSWQRAPASPRSPAGGHASKGSTPSPPQQQQQQPSKPSWHKVSVMEAVEVAPVDAAEQDFIYQCREGNLERALEMVREDADVLEEEDDDGASGLLWAVDRGNLELVKALVEASADVERCDGDGMAALHYAAQCGHAEIVAYLLEARARVDVTDSQGLKPEQLTEEPAILELLQQEARQRGE